MRSNVGEGNASQAQALIHKSIALFTELGARWDIARALTDLGKATAARDTSEARHIFLDAIRLATEVRAVPLVLDALVGLAHLQAQAGETERALELS